MSILILNRLPAILTNYKEWLKDFDEDITLFTQNKHKNNYQGLTHVEGFDNYIENHLIEVKAVEHFYKTNSFDTVIALDEVDIIRAARIRQLLGIKGQNLDSAYFYRNKIQMKNTLKDHVRCPNFKEISTMLDIDEFTDLNGLPVVIKPVDGMGGMDTFIINSVEELVETKEVIDLDAMNYMIESFVDGEMYSVDGLVIKDKIEFCSVSKYHNSVLVYKENKGHSLELVSPKEEIFTKLKRFTEKIIEVSPNPEILVFHCEIFVNKDNELIFCEIASRLGGARIPELIRQSYGINMEETYCRLLCNLKVDIPTNSDMLKHTAVYLIPKSNGKLISTIEKFPFDWVLEYQPYLSVGSESGKSISSSDIFGTVIFEANNKDELRERLDVLTKYTEENILWDEHKIGIEVQ